MKYEDLVDYIKLTETMILPEEVARIGQGATFLRKLPIKLQKWIAKKGSEKNPYMGFVVEPYAFFLSFGIRDQDRASGLLPKGYRLVPASMFAGGTPRPAAILSAFNVHTSVFWGSRVELYLVAENEKTGLMSWIIADYETNTISFDPGKGFSGATTARSVVTSSFKGEVIVDVEGRDSGNRLSLIANLNQGARSGLDRRLWVEGNLSVDYGGDHDDGDGQPFSLLFDPGEMEFALNVPLSAVKLAANTFGRDFLEPSPFEAACFPFAQHFVTTSVPVSMGVADERQLSAATMKFVDEAKRRGSVL